MLAKKYLALMEQYDLDAEDCIGDLLALLEKFAPDALKAEIGNIEEYLESWSE